MPLKRLGRKLRLPAQAIEKLGLQFHDKETTQFKVGKCQLISDYIGNPSLQLKVDP